MDPEPSIIPQIGKKNYKKPEHLKGVPIYQIVNCHDVHSWLKRLKQRKASAQEIIDFFSIYRRFNEDFIFPDAEELMINVIAEYTALARRAQLAVA